MKKLMIIVAFMASGVASADQCVIYGIKEVSILVGTTLAMKGYLIKETVEKDEVGYQLKIETHGELGSFVNRTIARVSLREDSKQTASTAVSETLNIFGTGAEDRAINEAIHKLPNCSH